jgi:soluble lytic murein transglycosylase
MKQKMRKPKVAGRVPPPGRAAGLHSSRSKRRLLLWILFVGVAVLLLAWRSDLFWNALSPVTQKKELYHLAGTYKIDPLLLAAIVRTESSFNPFAESRRGALGLMQLLPETAAEMARELRLNYQDQDDLYQQQTNLRLGVYYFSKLLKNFDGNLVLSLAAYNAGMGNVRSWNLQAYGRDQEEMIREIPLAETRQYVKKVIKHYRWFKWVQRIKRILQGKESS